MIAPLKVSFVGTLINPGAGVKGLNLGVATWQGRQSIKVYHWRLLKKVYQIKQYHATASNSLIGTNRAIFQLKHIRRKSNLKVFEVHGESSRPSCGRASVQFGRVVAAVSSADVVLGQPGEDQAPG